MRAEGLDRNYWLGWRTLLALVAALLLPLSIYALITIGTSYRDDRRAVEAATLARAQKITDAVDARLLTTAATMRVLATIRSIRSRDWQEAYDRSREIAALDPDWRSVALIDLDRGVRLFDLRERAPRPASLDSAVARKMAERSRARPTFSGMVTGPTGKRELEAYYAIGSGGKPQYLLRVTLDPVLVQRILMKLAPPDGTSAIVDTRGIFIARTKAWPERLGTPATIYVRRALASGRSGFYKSVTWEGFASYTAFTTLPDSEWTTHVAVSSSLIDSPQYGWRLSSILAALASLGLAALLVFLIMRLLATRRATELRAAQAERLEAVGQLTGGVAHDFNNMLAIVLGSLELASRRLSNGNTDIVRYIDNAMDGARRAADLTRRLLAFSRRQSLAPAAIDANALIEAMRELLKRTLSGDIRIETRLAADLWPTFVDPGQLENALVNLAVNARDAMPDGGMLTISTVNQPSRTGSVEDRIAITVTDTGSGMDSAVVARAFEPFFTTKEVGRGTGLGLSQIHGFATQSGGTATIASKVGEGTSVTLVLPRHHPSTFEPAASHIVGQDPTAPPGSTDEKILVVEDEEQVRLTNVEALRTLGYTVAHAADADQALAIIGSQPDISLLMTDIIMPGMNGRDLAAQIARTHPQIRILLVTGFERDQVEGDEYRILRKPFGIGELGRRVRRELDRRS